MTAAAVPAPQERARWRMTVEARALIVVTAVLLAFGLASLYLSLIHISEPTRPY